MVMSCSTLQRVSYYGGKWPEIVQPVSNQTDVLELVSPTKKNQRTRHTTTDEHKYPSTSTAAPNPMAEPTSLTYPRVMSKFRGEPYHYTKKPRCSRSISHRAVKLSCGLRLRRSRQVPEGKKKLMICLVTNGRHSLSDYIPTIDVVGGHDHLCARDWDTNAYWVRYFGPVQE